MRPRGPVTHTHRVSAALLRHLLAITEDDAIVVLGVLQIVLSEHRIAGRQRIPRQRDVLLGDMRGRAADFHIWPRALETTHQGILRFAVVIVVIIVVVVATATATVLLTLPHGLPFMLVCITTGARSSLMRRHGSSDPIQKFDSKVTTAPWIAAPALAPLPWAKSQ